MFHTLEKTVPSTDGIHTLRGTLYVPVGEIKGLVHVVHGMQEHMGRYEPFLRFLAQRGFLCFGYDHLGHGRTANGPEELGYFAPKNGWNYLVEDVHAFFSQVKAQYPGHPFILFGHSMGSFIVRLAAARYGEQLDGLIICGTGGPNSAAGAGIALTRLIGIARGKRHVSRAAEAAAFSQYNKRFPGEGPHAWLTRDPDIREAFAADPLCHFHFTVSAMEDLVRLNRACNRPACFAATPARLPVFLISGQEDPVGDYGAGVQAVFDAYQARGMEHLSMKLYPQCRHELLNELDREQVQADILSFLYSVI